MGDQKIKPKRGARRSSKRLTIEPLEVHLQLVGIQRNSKGEIVGTAVMAEGKVLPKDFATIPKQIKEVVEQHKEAAKEGEALS